MSDALPSNGNSSIRPASAVDIMKPMVIIDDEEVERLSGLIQRENLIRSLGVVEQVYRLLHGTPGTVSSVKAQPAGGAQYGGHNRISQAQYPVSVRLARTKDKAECKASAFVHANCAPSVSSVK